MARTLKKKNTTVQKVLKKKRKQRVASRRDEAKNQQPVFSIPNAEYVEAVGRRKVATARVRLYKKPGDYVVNDKIVGEYFANITQAAIKYNKPFHLTDTLGKYAVTVKVSGSGISSQLDAVIHGISRALIKIDPEFRLELKKNGLLSRDDRMKETRKIGMGGKARRKRQSPKR